MPLPLRMSPTSPSPLRLPPKLQPLTPRLKKCFRSLEAPADRIWLLQLPFGARARVPSAPLLPSTAPALHPVAPPRMARALLSLRCQAMAIPQSSLARMRWRIARRWSVLSATSSMILTKRTAAKSLTPPFPMAAIALMLPAPPISLLMRCVALSRVLPARYVSPQIYF